MSVYVRPASGDEPRMTISDAVTNHAIGLTFTQGDNGLVVRFSIVVQLDNGDRAAMQSSDLTSIIDLASLPPGTDPNTIIPILEALVVAGLGQAGFVEQV